MHVNLRATQETACRAYFSTYLPRLYGQLLLPGLHSLDCEIGVHVEDLEGAHWRLMVRSGRLAAVAPDASGVACIFRLDAATLLEIATGALAPDKAFFDLRIEIDGDVALGLQLSTVLEPFFQLFPYSMKAT
jgi:predicted lipid carrier protein YhbT